MFLRYSVGLFLALVSGAVGFSVDCTAAAPPKKSVSISQEQVNALLSFYPDDSRPASIPLAVSDPDQFMKVFYKGDQLFTMRHHTRQGEVMYHELLRQCVDQSSFDDFLALFIARVPELLDFIKPCELKSGKDIATFLAYATSTKEYCEEVLLTLPQIAFINAVKFTVKSYCQDAQRSSEEVSDCGSLVQICLLLKDAATFLSYYFDKDFPSFVAAYAKARDQLEAQMDGENQWLPFLATRFNSETAVLMQQANLVGVLETCGQHFAMKEDDRENDKKLILAKCDTFDLKLENAAKDIEKENKEDEENMKKSLAVLNSHAPINVSFSNPYAVKKNHTLALTLVGIFIAIPVIGLIIYFLWYQCCATPPTVDPALQSSPAVPLSVIVPVQEEEYTNINGMSDDL